MKPDIKKLVLLNLPYLFAFYFVDKVAAVFRLSLIHISEPTRH